MSKVFVSYRRLDSQGEAGRLGDVLESELGGGSFFRDVVSISPGIAFDEAIDKQLSAADVVLVLIGAEWLDELKARLNGTDTDYLRVEVARSLAANKSVIPVLINGAVLPAAADLPDDLRPLTRMQAISLRDEAWESDCDRILDAVGRPYSWGYLALRSSLVTASIIALVWSTAGSSGEVADIHFYRQLIAGLVSAYAAVELYWWYRHRRGT